MKILAVTDKVVDIIYSPAIVEKFGDVDVILSCGDLPYYYLEYIVSMLNVPLFYVHGNHDPPVEHSSSGQQLTGPGGGTNIHHSLVRKKGVSIVGLEGSIRYKPEGRFQYTQIEMWMQSFSLVPTLLIHRLFSGSRPDILLTHSPPYGIHNGRDRTHVGFTAFLWLMRWFKPRYLIHGHRHVYNPLEITETQYAETMVVNVYPYKVLEITDD